MAQHGSSKPSQKNETPGTTAQFPHTLQTSLTNAKNFAHEREKSSPLDVKRARFQHAKAVADFAMYASDRIWYSVMLQEASMARSEDSGTFAFAEDVNERRLDLVASARMAKDLARNARQATEVIENASIAALNVGRYFTGTETKSFKHDDTLTQKRAAQTLNQHLHKQDVAKYAELLGERTVSLNKTALNKKIHNFQEDNAALKRQIERLSNPTALSYRDQARVRGFISRDLVYRDSHRDKLVALIQSQPRLSKEDKQKAVAIISNKRAPYSFEKNKIERIINKRTPLTREDRNQIAELIAIKKEKDQALRDLVAFSKAKEQALKQYGSVSQISGARRIEAVLGRVDRANRKNAKEAQKIARESGYDAKLDKRLAKAKQNVLQARREAALLKREIFDFYAKGASLTSTQRKALAELLRNKDQLDIRLRRLIAEYRALRAQKAARDAILLRSNVLSPADKQKIAKLKENLRAYKAQAGIRKARRGRHQLKRSAIALVSAAARESEESGVQGLLKANRMIQSRFSRPVLIHFKKALIRPFVIVTKPARPILMAAAKGADAKFQVTRKMANTKSRIKHSKPALSVRRAKNTVKRELNGGIYNRVKGRVASVTPDPVKQGAEKILFHKRKATRLVSNKRKTFQNWQRKKATWFKNSVVGRSFDRVKQFFQTTKRAFSLSRFAFKKMLSAALCLMLVVCIISIFVTSSGVLGFSFVMTDETKDGKIDLFKYAEWLADIQKEWYNDLNDYVADSRTHYYEVNVEYLSDASTNNFKEMISMAAVYFGQDLDDEEAIQDYLTYLYDVSHYYETSQVGGISCSGCTTETTQCEGCVQGEYGSVSCPGHTSTICPGNHIRLNVELMVLGFDDIFWADDYAGSGATSTGGKYKGELIGKNFTITGYCSCTICCGQWSGGPTYSGVMPKANRTIAVDPDVIPLGTHVIINGKEYVAEDTGGAIKGNRIDMYFDSHQEAINWGKRYYDVYLATNDPGKTTTTRKVIDYSQYALLDLRIFLIAKGITLDRYHGQLLGDEYELSVEALEEYDNEHVNDPFTTAELNVFAYFEMSKSDLKKLCKKRDISYESTAEKNALIKKLVQYDLKHPDEEPLLKPDDINPGETEEEQGLLFEGWTEENVEWAKNIYENMTDENYYGLDQLNGSYNSSDGFSGYEIKEGSTVVMYYSQYDTRWKDSSYGSSTIGKSGCGPTSMAMVISSLSGTTVDPVQMCNWAASNGYYVSGVGTSWSFITGAASHWGLRAQQVGKGDIQTIIDALSSGKLVVMSTGKGTYYQGKGHFLVLRGVTKDGKILVADPASEEKTQKAWAISDITSGLKAWWVIGK